MYYETPHSEKMRARAKAIKNSGGMDKAIENGSLPPQFEASLSEGIVLGLLKQGVSKYLVILGHGSTDLGEVLRIYQEEGVTQTFNFRNEVAMAHTATALSWQYGEVPAVVTSIGPGGLQAMAGSLAAASNGIGVYHIYGDETTHGEGYNMQQIPKPEKGLYGRLTAIMGESYVLHTPEALRDMLRLGTNRVHHSTKAGPFYMLLPINTQPQLLQLNLNTLPERVRLPQQAPAGENVYSGAIDLIQRFDRIVIKAGGGCRKVAKHVQRLAEATGAAVTLSPGSTGVLPDDHPQNMHVGGSKGSMSGNYAMREANLVIVIGSRSVCQADCSGIGYEKAERVININADLTDVTHYNKTHILQGDIGAIIDRLLAVLESSGGANTDARQSWLSACLAKKKEWQAFKAERYATPSLADEVFDKPVLTQPAAIKIASDFAKSINAAKFFDAGDVQANGFQIVEDDRPDESYTETGASYMGFAVSGIIAAGLADKPVYSIAFTGDGSFMMNPQVLIDAVAHNVKGMIVIFDNRRMAAITGLQEAQYGNGFCTSDGVAVDYVQLASAVSGIKAIYGGEDAHSFTQALSEAHNYDGLSVVHVPVYYGSDERAGMGAYGSWNVGNWVADVQSRWHAQEI